MQALDLFPPMPASCDCAVGGCGCDAAEQGCLCGVLEPRQAVRAGLAPTSSGMAPAVPSFKGLFGLMAGSLLMAAALISVAEAHTAPRPGAPAAAARHIQLP